MKQKLFISYSRRQAPFVDRLAEELEKSGYSLWLDYHNLVPARPWDQQIETSISEADTIILVVSKNSLESKNVTPEWKHALELKKRIVLVIFEAFPLAAELRGCEWVDFRGNYRKSLKQLENLLANPTRAMTSLPPQSGFKAPISFWLALFLSVVVLIGSVPAWWTIFVPFVLVPLPWQIYKRNYIFSRVVPALFFLPVFIFFTSMVFFDQGNILYSLNNFSDAWEFPTVLASWALLWLLFTPVMQRRAVPEAARVRFANPLVVDVKQPRSVVFAIDHAPEDGRYAEDLRRGLEQYGHRLVNSDEKPEAAFVLLSTYKTGTEYDPEHQAVYPILLQAVDNIAPNLQRIQWLDFRNGIRTINKLAKLLPEPERLLQALAITPTGSQEIFPLAVNALQYFYLLIGIMGVGGLLTSMLSFTNLIFSGHVGLDQIGKLIIATINGLLLFGAVLYSVRGLRLRTGGTAAVYPLLILTIFQAAIYLSNLLVLMVTSNTENDSLFNLLYTASVGTISTFFAFLLGALIALPFLVFRWRELYRWLPRRQINSTVGRMESILLLYSPLRQRALVFHVIFHVILLLLFFLFSFVGDSIDFGAVLCIVLPLLIIAFGVRWQARRISK
jgi:hypothetical protein